MWSKKFFCWKALPSKSLASRRENAAPGYKVSKYSLTVMVCPNAKGKLTATATYR